MTTTSEGQASIITVHSMVHCMNLAWFTTTNLGLVGIYTVHSPLGFKIRAPAGSTRGFQTVLHPISMLAHFS